MITAAQNILVLNSAIAASIDNIDVISISTSAGENFRKAYQQVESVSSVERKYTFYLTEDEANVTITKLALFGNGATTTLASGTEMATQNVNIPKTNIQSLLIYWNVRVVN